MPLRSIPSFPFRFQPFLVLAVTLAALLSPTISTGFAAEPGAVPSPDLRVMTFNIRNSAARDGANNWEARENACLSVIGSFRPDLLGLQEVLADQHDALKEKLPNYQMVGVARDDGDRKGEWSAILFRKDRFELISHGDFWLSETPDNIGSQSWDAACVRICTWARLRDRLTGNILLHANTHFDHQSAGARLHSAELIRQRLPKLAGDAGIILTGDFNCTEDDPPYAILVNPVEAPLHDSYRGVHLTRRTDEATFHGFKGGTAGSRIDWILHTPNWKAHSAEIIRGPEERLPSDHFPVTALLIPIP